jgi:hypothetical protein
VDQQQEKNEHEQKKEANPETANEHEQKKEAPPETANEHEQKKEANPETVYTTTLDETEDPFEEPYVELFQYSLTASSTTFDNAYPTQGQVSMGSDLTHSWFVILQMIFLL